MFIDLAHDGMAFAQGTMPRLDGMYWLMLASRVLHILAAIILVGGLFYLRVIVAPRMRQSDAGAASDPWFAGRRSAWAMWVGIASLLLIDTGLWNFVQTIRRNEIATMYHMLGTAKIVAGLVVFFLAAVLAGKSLLAERFRQQMKLWLGICLVVAIIVVIIGSVMRSFPRTPQPIEGPQLVAPANN